MGVQFSPGHARQRFGSRLMAGTPIAAAQGGITGAAVRDQQSVQIKVAANALGNERPTRWQYGAAVAPEFAGGGHQDRTVFMRQSRLRFAAAPAGFCDRGFRSPLRRLKTTFVGLDVETRRSVAQTSQPQGSGDASEAVLPGHPQARRRGLHRVHRLTTQQFRPANHVCRKAELRVPVRAVEGFAADFLPKNTASTRWSGPRMHSPARSAQCGQFAPSRSASSSVDHGFRDG